MAEIAAGWANQVQLLIDALGLRGRPTQRVIIDISCNDAIRIYVKELMTGDKLEALTEAFRIIQLKQDEKLQINDDCSVQIIPSAKKDS